VSAPSLAGIGDPSAVARIHIVGIGGAGMSAIATVLVAMGHQVTGSDLRESVVTDRLRAQGIPVTVGHHAAAVGDADLVTHSTAVSPTNPERAEAVRRGIPVASRAEVLAAVAARRRCIAVAGTHGKTTTSSMLALILVEAGLRPSFLIGGDVNEIGTNAVWDVGEWIVVEADESDGTFLHLRPEIAVVTNVEADHLDHFGTFDAVRSAFAEFLASTSGARVVCADDGEAAALGRAAGAALVGTGAEPGGPAAWRIGAVETARSSATFELTPPGAAVGIGLRLAVPGIHNDRNASVAAVAALAAGATWEAATAALGRFGGVARRFEFRGQEAGITFVDDYAHLPTEVRATLAAAADGGWERVVAVFQPHRYSRTAEVGEEFGPAFVDADLVVVTDVYSAGEAPIPGISGRTVADAAARHRPAEQVRYLPGRSDLASQLAGILQAGDLCLTLGAGDLTALPDEILDLLGRDRARADRQGRAAPGSGGGGSR
jgi:UDP-N-acetylmuramate--alanine ligase